MDGSALVCILVVIFIIGVVLRARESYPKHSEYQPEEEELNSKLFLSPRKKDQDS